MAKDASEGPAGIDMGSSTLAAFSQLLRLLRGTPGCLEGLRDGLDSNSCHYPAC